MVEDGRTAGAGVLRLEARGISKRYGAVEALADVRFELRAGEVMALLGENGAGKSTLVKVLAGLVEPDEGVVEIDGVPTGLFPVSTSQAAGVAVVHQEFSSVPSMTVAENLALGSNTARFVWLSGRLNRQAKQLLERVGLAGLDPRTPVERLTVAEEQLVEVARVLSRDARIVVFDEPTAPLSDVEIERVLGVISSLAEEGRSIVYVTHRLREVFRIADRVTVFRNGRSAPPADVSSLSPDRVVSMMLGRELAAMYPPRATSSIAAKPILEVDGLQAAGLEEPVSIDVRPGEMIGLTGQLGSGANAVVAALAGAIPGTAGTVRLNGAPLRLRGRAAGIRRHIGYCSADRKTDGIFAEKSIVQNLSSPWLRVVERLGWIRRRTERQRARDIASDFAVNVDRLDSNVGDLSGGNQQKIALGKWLGIEPAVLLLDEPTRGVDVGARAEIYGRLRALCDRGAAIVVASSDVSEVLGLCDRIGSFYRGRLTAVRPYTEWSEESLVLEVMHGDGPTN